MKKLGLIGGTGPESTLRYYRKFVYEANKRNGDTFFPNLTIESINVYDVLEMCSQKDYAGLTDYLAEAVRHLTAVGAEVAALTGNTPHIVFNELQACSAIPLVSIIDATCAEVKAQGLKKVGLLGTRFTMEADFFKRPFIEAGIDVITPILNDIDFVAEKIHYELERGIVKIQMRERFLAVVERMSKYEGIEAIILGCTELPLLFTDVQLAVPALDTVDIHIEALFNALR
ncbi:aspartate racemase [Candidatus Symbiopectobacterium sp. 'North America']|uniref:aspartate/glutamate racemase family protein n=1 Tax=Candidatus Symbiopectobacterium sp. 'North America' TaxID=2794574 RepID=UPI0018CBE5A1|nr:amino acid racemase [Candidatus Symbiopectobacterium sp. 'North America']MBG6244750.1 aspartate racemase [Candidatus Symbiopectobacterium sp. 'North America']